VSCSIARTLGLLLLCICGAGAEDPSARTLFLEAWYQETGEEDPAGAIPMYEKVVSRAKDSGELAAKAQYQIGICREKLDAPSEAQEAFQKVLDDFPQQLEVCDRARAKLSTKGPALPNAPPVELEEHLRATKMSLDFTVAPLPDVVTFLREYLGGVNIHLYTYQIPRPDQLTVTLMVEDLPAEQCLNLIAKANDLSWYVTDNILIIGTKGGIERHRQLLQSMPAAVSTPQDPEWKRNLASVLTDTLIDLDFTDDSLEDIVGFVRLYAKINIEMDALVRKQGTADKKIAFCVRGLSVRSVLRILLPEFGLTYELSDGMVVITRPSEQK